MARLQELKAHLDTDPDCAAVRFVSISGGIASCMLYKDVDGYYVVSSLEGDHKECWFRWENAVACVGGSWVEAEDWRIQVRECSDDLLTLQYVATRLNISEDTVRRWAKQGILDAVPLPSSGKHQSYRVRRAVLNALLRRSTRQVVAFELAS